MSAPLKTWCKRRSETVLTGDVNESENGKDGDEAEEEKERVFESYCAKEEVVEQCGRGHRRWPICRKRSCRRG